MSSPTKKTSLMNLGHYFEDNLGAYILYKLCERKNDFDWKFGMEKEEEFPKFDDIVLGIQPQETYEMAYYAFQLKGYDNQDGTVIKSIGMNTLLPELTRAGNHGNQTLYNYFCKGFKKMSLQDRRHRMNFILFHQFEFRLEYDSYSKYFINLKQDELGVFSSLIPSSKNAEFRKLSEEAIRELSEKPEWKVEDAKKVEEFLTKVLIFSNQPDPHEIKDLGSHFKYWDLLRIKGYDQKFDRLKQWISKRELIQTRVTFQGQKSAVPLSDLIHEPDSELLIKLIANKEISVGKEVKGLGKQNKYYIERTFQRQDKDGKIVQKCESELLKERIVLIEGEPGLGKTITLKHAARELKKKEGSNTWVMEINMASMTHAFQKLGKALETGISVNPLKLLQEVINYGDNFGDMCFENLEKACDLKISIFLDAFDEISANEKDTALRWIESICKSPRMETVWISTRRYDSAAVQKACGVNSFSIARFEISDQIKFMTKFWKEYIAFWEAKAHYIETVRLLQNYNHYIETDYNFDNVVADAGAYAETKMEAIAEQLLKNIDKSLKVIIGLPLQTMMLAEIYAEDCQQIMAGKSNVEECNLVKFTILSIFEDFIDKKFTRELEKYATINSGTITQYKDTVLATQKEKFVFQHEFLSLDHIFKQHDGFQYIVSGDFPKMVKTLKYDLQSGNIISGIVTDFQDDGQLLFIHRMFAEYFTSHWLFETLKRLIEEEKSFGECPPHLKRLITFLQNHYTKPENEKVKLFLSLMAAKGHQQHTEIVRNLHSRSNENTEVVLHQCELDQLGRDPLHLFLENEKYLDVAYKETRNFQFDNLWDKILRNEWWLMACYKGNCELARQLLALITDVNHAQRYMLVGYTALHLACIIRSVEMTKILLEHPAININAISKRKVTPLHLASESNSIDIVKMLIEKGATVNSKDWQGRTSLHMTGKEEICTMLLDRGADVNSPDEDLNTPLHYACRTYRGSIAKLLIQRGGDLNARNMFGYTPLRRKNHITWGERHACSFL